MSSNNGTAGKRPDDKKPASTPRSQPGGKQPDAVAALEARVAELTAQTERQSETIGELNAKRQAAEAEAERARADAEAAIAAAADDDAPLSEAELAELTELVGDVYELRVNRRIGFNDENVPVGTCVGMIEITFGDPNWMRRAWHDGAVKAYRVADPNPGPNPGPDPDPIPATSTTPATGS